jgi:hypothetical protein
LVKIKVESSSESESEWDADDVNKTGMGINVHSDSDPSGIAFASSKSSVANANSASTSSDNVEPKNETEDKIKTYLESIEPLLLKAPFLQEYIQFMVNPEKICIETSSGRSKRADAAWEAALDEALGSVLSDMALISECAAHRKGRKSSEKDVDLVSKIRGK